MEDPMVTLWPLTSDSFSISVANPRTAAYLSRAQGKGGGVPPQINGQLTVSLATGVAGSSSRLKVAAANIFM